MECEELQSVSLSFNRLTGGLPDGLGVLSKLFYFKVRQNNSLNPEGMHVLLFSYVIFYFILKLQ